MSIVDLFCKTGEASLDSLGLSRVHGLKNMSGPLGQEAVLFRCASNLYLDVSFDPIDSNSASTRYGRRWCSDDGWWALSNSYFRFARHYHLEFPEYHVLGYGDGFMESLRTIFGDIESTLPAIESGIRTHDLVQIESEGFGAKISAQRRYGPTLAEKITIDGDVRQ